MTEILVRNIEYRDIESVCNIMLSIDPYKTLGYTHDICIETVISNIEEGWGAVAEIDGRIVGFVLFRVFDGFPLGGYIRALGVHHGYRSMGVGTKLMDYAEKVIFKYRENVFLLVSSFNEQAIRFYTKRGYKAIGVIENAIVKGYHEIIMRKTRDSWGERFL
ncbi:hypothetical protein ATG_14950 [Desulfurococcaceae archaeon AG1]|nr:hypothetical protein ATG_14950 [Desulfurococcaceae archaeon AG1]HWQ16907.1 GNAT family N-acetyltransferase [Sulfolobales archaeon]